MTWLGMLVAAGAVVIMFGLGAGPPYQPAEPLIQPSPVWNGQLARAIQEATGAESWRLGVGLHAGSAALVYALAVALVRRARRAGGPESPPASRAWGEGQRGGELGEGQPARRAAAAGQLAGLAAALLWGLHPLRVPVVYWAVWMGISLGTLPALVALLAYLRAVGSPRRTPWLALALAAYAISLLASPIALFLPLVILVLNLWPLGRGRRPRAWAETAAFAVVATVAAAGVARGLAESQPAPPVAALSAVQRALLGVFATAWHAGRTIWPVGAVPINELSLPVEAMSPRYLTAAALVVAVCASAGALVRRLPAVSVALAAYLALLLPAVWMIPVGPVETAWPQAYFASTAGFVLLGGFVGVGLERVTRRSRSGAAAIVVVMVACTAGLALLTRQHSARWRSADEFWGAVLAANPRSGLAYYFLAQEQEALGSTPRAIALYRAAGQNAGWIVAAHVTEAWLLAEDGEFGEAADAYRRALSAGARDAFVHRELAVLLAVLDRPEQAEEHFRAALRQAPDDLRARRGLANLLTGQRRCGEALEVLGHPPVVDAAAYWYDRGRAHRCAGDAAAARRAFERALAADPNFTAARRALNALD